MNVISYVNVEVVMVHILMLLLKQFYDQALGYIFCLKVCGFIGLTVAGLVLLVFVRC
jgi:hypothetical protein